MKKYPLFNAPNVFAAIFGRRLACRAFGERIYGRPFAKAPTVTFGGLL